MNYLTEENLEAFRKALKTQNKSYTIGNYITHLMEVLKAIHRKPKLAISKN